MSTIGDLTKDNPFYDEGVFMDKDYYKSRLESRSAEVISQAELDSAYKMQFFIEVAKKVSLVAFVLIPSIQIFGLGMACGVAAASVLVAVMSTSENSPKDTFLNAIELKSHLLASLSQSEKAKVLFLDIGMYTVPCLTFGVLSRIQYTSKVLAFLGISFVGSSIWREVERYILSGIDGYIERKHQEEFESKTV